MSHCLVCDDRPVFSNDDLLVHMANAHGWVDLTEPAATRRTARARLVAIATVVAAVAAGLMIAAAFLGLLVRIFTLVA